MHAASPLNMASIVDMQHLVRLELWRLRQGTLTLRRARDKLVESDVITP